jgi:SHS2 domain-containing protein
MASKADIKKAILEVAGNPDSGVIRELADAWADAIVALDDVEANAKVQEGVPSEKPEKEVRIIKATESR